MASVVGVSGMHHALPAPPSPLTAKERLCFGSVRGGRRLRTPEETALSIVAELVASRRGWHGLPLMVSHEQIRRDVRVG